MSEVGFDKLQHLVTVPVSVNGVDSRFVLDSGIGLTLLRSELAESMRVRPTGASFTGRRMSGQSVTIPLGEVPTMTFAGSTFEQVEVGIFDMSSFPAELAVIGGFLSLAFFADRPLTVDYGNHQTENRARYPEAPAASNIVTRTSCSSGSSTTASSATPSCGDMWSRSMSRAQRSCSASHEAVIASN